ncbi:hypothetical protein CAPTEDRAFT_217492 [Capitella teleta]|uniref:Cadherin domain-containing protein n=1 Tax=Capitella teleta TaxID=283909 RepID=R7UNZ3_CAPTE|nr:hypothetical protein CAPTEDRAFT_217492 [Capitella teleta]|eukprot:ELU05647.1 hypothetical protein CAPTEDRAFT_217492 [Capitella teleta]
MIILLLLTLFVANCFGQECSTGTTLGSASVSYRHGVSDAAGRTYLNTGDLYKFNCIGMITEISFHCHKDGSVRFQVWRPTSANEATLIEEVATTVSGCEAGEITLFADNFAGYNITLQDNDPNIDANIINDVSSVEVLGYQSWRVYDTIDYRGEFYEIKAPGQHAALGAVGQDNAESVARLGEPRLLQLEGIPVKPGDTLAIVQDGGQVVFDEYMAGSSACCLFYYMDTSTSLKGNVQTFPLPNAVRREYSLALTLNPRIIHTKDALDFETQTSHMLTIQVTDSTHTTLVVDTLTINICDIYEEHTVANLPNEVILNIKDTALCDNPFVSLWCSFYFCRHFPMFQFGVTATAYTGQAAVFTYNLVSLTPPDGSFGLDAVTGEVQCLDQIVMVDKLNPVYYMEISVVDPVGVHVVGPLNLTIRLININSPPVFTNMPGIARVPEDQTSGAIFHMQVNDTDDDFFNFTLTGVTPPDMADIFRYNYENGTVTVTNPNFDYETGLREFRLRFTTNDHLHTSQEQELTVYITDVNEPPKCWPEDYHLTIPEKTPTNTRFPIYLNATDQDYDDTIDFSLDPDMISQYFTINGHYIYQAEPVDLGTNVDQTYDLIARALDKAGLYCEVHIYITVTQINDPHYIENLPEVIFVDSQTTSAGDVVYTVKVSPKEPDDAITFSWEYPDPSDGVEARDPDSDLIIRYNLLSVYPKSGVTKFTLDANSGYTLQCITSSLTEVHSDGNIETVANPDFNFEKQSTYVLTVSVEDSLHTSEAQNFTIAILDVNEPPEATVIKYTGEVHEESATGHIIHLWPSNLDAFDPDFNDTVTFQLLDSQYSDFFTLNDRQLMVDRRMDRDLKIPGTVALQVGTTDQSGLSGPVLEITVTVDDINDHAPVFQKTSYKGSVTENAYGGTYILTVQATDTDVEIPNRIFNYVINDTYSKFDEGQTFFMVDPNTGDVRVKHQIDYDRFPVVEFEVLAIDEGVYPESLTGTTTVTITVGDVNDGRPEFVQDFFSLEMSSKESVGHYFLTLNATDVDSIRTSNLTYYFMKYDSHFFIDHSSAELTLRRTVEDNTKYVLYALARDNGIPTEEISNVAIVRIDSFKPADHLVDIELAIPLKNYESIEEDFLESIRKVIAPWYPKVQHVYGQQDFRGSRRKLLASTDDTKTIVTMYALENMDAYELAHLTEEKKFIGRNDLLGKLRTDITGTPSKDLQTPEFADYFVTNVSPTHPIWIIDTVAGITVLTFLILGTLLAIIGISLCCCRRSPACGFNFCDRFKRVLCPCLKSESQTVTPTRIKSRPPSSESGTTRETIIQSPPPNYGNEESDFQLRYAKSTEYHQTQRNVWKEETFNKPLNTVTNDSPVEKTDSPLPSEQSIRNRRKPPSASRTVVTGQGLSTDIEKNVQRQGSFDSEAKRTSSEATWKPRNPQMIKDDNLFG